VPIDIKTTILHYKPLRERKENMIRQMNHFQFTDYSFYEEFDSNELNQETIDRYCIRKHKDWNTVAKKIAPWKIGIETQKELNMAEISLTIKFGKVFERLSDCDDDIFIVFEDDVFLCQDFDTRFYSYLNNTPDDWDVIYFGSGAKLKPSETHSDQTAYLMQHPASRCADSIVLKKSTVRNLASTWFPFHMISDWELGYQHYIHNHKIYWWEPSLVKQGSEYGMFKSTLR
jgi:hypothetical protein